MLIIETQASTYVIDTDNKWVIRTPAQEALGDYDVAQLRKDGEKIPLLEMGTPTIGERLHLTLDIVGNSVVTHRETTPVRTILTFDMNDVGTILDV